MKILNAELDKVRFNLLFQACCAHSIFLHLNPNLGIVLHNKSRNKHSQKNSPSEGMAQCMWKFPCVWIMPVASQGIESTPHLLTGS